MADRLTDEELDEMKSYTGSLYARAEAEIRELRAENAELQAESGTSQRMRQLQVADLEKLKAENAKLREYVEHRPSCHRNIAITIPQAKICTCGLDDLLGKAVQ